MMRTALAVMVFGLAVQSAPAQANGDKVLKSYSDNFVENLVRDVDPSFKKGSDRANNPFWDFKMDKYKVRITNYGSDMMIDAIFGKIDVDVANKWNQTAKFSRVVLYDGGGKPYSAVEANLDCVGGVTENIARQWIKRFGLEVKRYAKFVQKSDFSEKVYTRITPEIIEKMMRDMNINFRKGPKQNNVTIYEFTNEDNYRVQLYLFRDTDLMLAGNFPATTLDKINSYNLKRKFIRAVLYQGNNRPYTSLESNLDCVAGVSPSMIRYFFNAFRIDLRDFAKKLFNGQQN